MRTRFHTLAAVLLAAVLFFFSHETAGVVVSDARICRKPMPASASNAYSSHDEIGDEPAGNVPEGF